jgi:uncharacterized membrane protein YcgQ (UPF0703/DUF1980 family)
MEVKMKYRIFIKPVFLLLICLVLTTACGSSAASSNADRQGLTTEDSSALASTDGVNGTSSGDDSDGFQADISADGVVTAAEGDIANTANSSKPDTSADENFIMAEGVNTGAADGSKSDASADGTVAAAEGVNTNTADSSKTGTSADENVIEIREKMFIAQTNDIYLNAEEYLGKTLRYQGYFETIEDEDSGEVYCFVIRNGPGCCPGVDNTAGFEVAWDKPWPNPNDWVEATGVLEEYEFEPGGMKYLRVNLKDLTVLVNRGAETVLQ